MDSDYQGQLKHLGNDDKLALDREAHEIDPHNPSPLRIKKASRVEDQIRQRTVKLTETLAYLQRTNQQLVTAKESAEQASRSKTQFLAATSHDVMQPLNAALLLISTLGAVQTGNEGKRLCRQVERSLETMDTLLRNLLYVSRLDSGEIEPHVQTVSLDRLFESIESDFEPIAKIRNLELRVRYSGLHVWSDATMLRRIVQNIVANALRYTRKGGVLLIASKHKEQVRVRVADTGVGIKKHHFKDIFIEFQRCTQAQDETDGYSAGMGLGLAIVKRMAESLNHELTLNSRIGYGSCFNLGLPLTQAPNAHQAFTRSKIAATDNSVGKKLANTRVLVIENDLPALQAMEALLGRWGCELRLASSTQEAMSALSREQAWIPEIIVADQHLNNNERGTSAIRELRQLVGRQIPAIVVTDNPTSRLWKKADYGHLEVIQKPLKPAELRALLTHLQAPSNEVST